MSDSLGTGGALGINCYLADDVNNVWRYQWDGEAALISMPGDGTLALRHFPAGQSGELLPAPDGSFGVGATLDLSTLPTADPLIVGRAWCDPAAAFVVKVSQG